MAPASYNQGPSSGPPSVAVNKVLLKGLAHCLRLPSRYKGGAGAYEGCHMAHEAQNICCRDLNRMSLLSCELSHEKRSIFQVTCLPRVNNLGVWGYLQGD